jgi:sulfate adenylyltransferase (ADP) / ATP adenylyltransferase
MDTMKPMLEGRVLGSALQRAAQHALACGALQPIESELHVIEEGGVRFLVRQLSPLGRRRLDRRRARGAAAPNPFLPFDPKLFVADISRTHVALLNKFALIPHHMLIVTRRFEAQEALLCDADFEALCVCLAQVDGLTFYNGGAVAGASQPHKHLQMVPLPLESAGSFTPIDAVLDSVRDQKGILAVPGLIFPHAFTWLDPGLFEQDRDAAAQIASLYSRLHHRIGIHAIERNGERHQSGPWNLLVTRKWMLAVPRQCEDFRGVAINALGFAGSLFVRDEKQLAVIVGAGPMAALAAVAGLRSA